MEKLTSCSFPSSYNSWPVAQSELNYSSWGHGQLVTESGSVICSIYSLLPYHMNTSKLADLLYALTGIPLKVCGGTPLNQALHSLELS